MLLKKNNKPLRWPGFAYAAAVVLASSSAVDGEYFQLYMVNWICTSLNLGQKMNLEKKTHIRFLKIVANNLKSSFHAFVSNYTNFDKSPIIATISYFINYEHGLVIFDIAHQVFGEHL